MRLVHKTTAAELELPSGLFWSDEFNYNPTAAEAKRSITGALLVQVSEKTGGRPITLKGDSQANWIKRSELEILQSWAAQGKQQFTLKLEYPADTREFNTIFDIANGALEAEPVLPGGAPKQTDYFRVLIRLLEVVA